MSKKRKPYIEERIAALEEIVGHLFRVQKDILEKILADLKEEIAELSEERKTKKLARLARRKPIKSKRSKYSS